MPAQIETEQIIFQRSKLAGIVDQKAASRMIPGIMVMIVTDNLFDNDDPDVELLALNIYDLIFLWNSS